MLVHNRETCEERRGQKYPGGVFHIVAHKHLTSNTFMFVYEEHKSQTRAKVK